MAIRRKGRQRASGSGGLAPLRRSRAAWLATLALVLQLGFGGVSHWPAAGSSAAERAVTALSAAVGQEVSLCAEGAGGHSGAPNPSYPCCDDCALCASACHASVLAPARAAGLFAPSWALAAELEAGADENALPPVFFSTARSRAPPVPV